MKIKLMHIDPKVCELIQSNNQQEKRMDVMSEQIARAFLEIQKLKDENQRRKSQEF